MGYKMKSMGTVSYSLLVNTSRTTVHENRNSETTRETTNTMQKTKLDNQRHVVWIIRQRHHLLLPPSQYTIIKTQKQQEGHTSNKKMKKKSIIHK